MAKRGVLNQRFNSIFDDNSFDEDLSLIHI